MSKNNTELSELEKNRIIGNIRMLPINQIDVYALLVKRELTLSNVIIICNFLVDYVTLKFGNSKENLTEKFIEKLIYSVRLFLLEFSAQNYKISFEVSSKLCELKTLYEYYCKKSKIESSPQVEEEFRLLESFIENSVDLETSSEKIYSMQQRIDDLLAELEVKQNAISELKAQILSLNSSVKNSIQEKEKLVSSLEEKNGIADSQADTIRELQANIDSLSNSLKEIRSRLSALLSISSQPLESSNILNEISESISAIEGTITLKVETIEFLKSEIDLYEKEKNYLLSLKKLEDILLAEVIKKSQTASELLTIIQNEYREYRNVTISDIKAALMRINSRVSIYNSKNIIIPQKYGIVKPSFVVGANVCLEPNNSNFIEIVATADWHLFLDSETANVGYIDSVNGLYEYCAANNVNYVINVGDLLDIRGFSRKDYMYDELLYFLDAVIEQLPKDDNITNLILGGNHDEMYFKIGIDPLQRIVNERSDVISIGYRNASLRFGEGKKVIGFHHPSSRMESNGLSEKYGRERLFDHLNSTYYSQIENKDFIFANIVGHIHASSFDAQYGLCLCPSLTEDRYANGAWHIKIHLDDSNNPDYALFIPLINIDNRMYPTSEIVYERSKCLTPKK